MTLEPDPATASAARQSMQSWPLDCRVATLLAMTKEIVSAFLAMTEEVVTALLAMTEEVVTASAARQSMQPDVMDCFTSFAMTVGVHGKTVGVHGKRRAALAQGWS